MDRVFVLGMCWKAGFMGRLLKWFVGRLVLYPMSGLEVLFSCILCWLEERFVGWVEVRLMAWVEGRFMGWVEVRLTGWVDQCFIGLLEIGDSDWLEVVFKTLVVVGFMVFLVWGFFSGSLNCFTNVFLILISTENGVSEITKLRLDVLTCLRIWSQISWTSEVDIVRIYFYLI